MLFSGIDGHYISVQTVGTIITFGIQAARCFLSWNRIVMMSKYSRSRIRIKRLKNQLMHRQRYTGLIFLGFL